MFIARIIAMFGIKRRGTLFSSFSCEKIMNILNLEEDKIDSYDLRKMKSYKGNVMIHKTVLHIAITFQGSSI